ncbi:MAG TPA: site-2 protease family protein [Acidimicrobiales bacterium]|nr:site-2 protease family protein [Acidimicrobiales bacterium]
MAWVIAGLALVVVLVRTHHISTFSILAFCALIPSVILHEVSHGAVALAFGDDTAKRAGRLTLNPISHIDPFGTIILPVLLSLSSFGIIGWAKPVPVNVSRLRHPRNEGVAVSLVGPAVNIVLAILFGLAYRFLVPFADKITFNPGGLPGPTWAQFIFVAGYINVILAAFNLIPLPPLDGSAVLERLLPASALPVYYRIRPFTMFIPLGVVLLFPSALSHVFDPALNEWGRLLGI